ncbi:hypothetical protein ACHAXT_012543 [Thalassiosira profunda]
MSNPSVASPPAPPLSTPSLAVTGRIFVITGGTQGLGLEIARQLKRKGAAAIVLVSRSPDKAQAALDQLDSGVGSPTGCVIKFVRADLSDAKEASSIVPQAIQLLSDEPSLPKPITISGAVNAAATTSRGNLLNTTAAMFDEQFATNVRGPFLVTQSAAQHMIEHTVPRGVGSIVNICSVAAKGGAPFILGYSCAKSALVTLTKNNAAELAPHGIRVNGVNMGWTFTENEHKLQSKVHNDEEWWKTADDSVPLGRILRPADVAASVLFLLSGASAMMSGSILDLHPEYSSGMLSLATDDTPDR